MKSKTHLYNFKGKVNYLFNNIEQYSGCYIKSWPLLSKRTWVADNKWKNSFDALQSDEWSMWGERSWRPGMTSPPCPKPWCNGSHNKKTSGASWHRLIINISNNCQGKRTGASLHHHGNKGCAWGIPAIPAQPTSFKAFKEPTSQLIIFSTD